MHLKQKDELSEENRRDTGFTSQLWPRQYFVVDSPVLYLSPITQKLMAMK